MLQIMPIFDLFPGSNTTLAAKPPLECTLKATGVYFPRKRPIDRYPVRVRGIYSQRNLVLVVVERGVSLSLW